MLTSTYFALLAEFGTAEIELSKVCEKFFGLKEDEAKRHAAMRRLPIAAHRGGSQKSPWLINAADLAKLIDDRRAAAVVEWQRSRAA